MNDSLSCGAEPRTMSRSDSERRPCHAGKELDRAKRIPARARNAGQLFFVDRALHHLAWRRIDDGGFAKAPVRGPLLCAEPVDDLGDLPGGELLFGFEVAVFAADNRDLVLPRLEVGRDEGPVRSGNQVSDELASLVGNLDADRARGAVVFGEQMVPESQPVVISSGGALSSKTYR